MDIIKKFVSYFVISILAGLSACSTIVDQNSKPSLTTKQSDRAFKTYSAEEFYQTTSFSGSSFSADGSKLLIGSDESGIINLYTVDTKTGVRNTLTDFSDTTYPVRWFPNDDRVLFTRDSEGNELYHLYVRELDGSIQDLTPGENNRARFIGFVKDGKKFYVTSNERDAKFMDLYRYDTSSYERELVYTNNDAFSLADVSLDGRNIVLTKTISNSDSDLYLLDLTKIDAEPQLITGLNQNPVQHDPMTFSTDSKTLYYRTNEYGEYFQIWGYDIVSGERKLALKADWDVSFYYLSENGKYRISGINADASLLLTTTNTETGQEVTMPPLPEGDLRGIYFSNDESTMAFYVNADTSPSNLYIWKIGDSQASQFTQALNENINPNDLVSSEVVRFESFDGLEIPGILYKPKQASATNKIPALVYVHGGPGGQSRTGYNPRNQHLVNNGYAVFMVNNRGSSGYGKTFFHMDDRDHGGADLQDIVYGKKYLETLDWVDQDKIGIIGGSYGGFMTAAAMAFEPDVFEVGIDIFGVTNWVRTLESIPPWWEAFKKSLYDEMGDPAVDGDRHRAISPLFHAQNIKKPLLVIQGANDPRVLKVESDELVEKVRENDVPVEYIVFDDEGHGFTKKKNRITASKAYLTFLQEYLPKE